MCLGIPARVVEVISEDFYLATVEVAGARRTVNVGTLPDGGRTLRPGEWVLVHAGFALERLDEAEATATLQSLRELNDTHRDELVLSREYPSRAP